MSSITNEIKSSVSSYLLAASPRSEFGSQPATPASHSRTKSVVLSPWNGCVGASLDSYSPFTGSVTPPTGLSPELHPSIVLPQPSALRYQCSLSPTRNRFSSPKASTVPDAESFVFDIKSIPDLEDDVSGSSSSSGSSSGSSSSSSSATSSPESRIDVECQSLLKTQGVFSSRQSSLPEKLSLYSTFQLAYSSNKPPRPPRHVRRLSGKFEVASGIARGKSRGQQGGQECGDSVTISVISFLLFVLFIILVVYGGPVK